MGDRLSSISDEELDELAELFLKERILERTGIHFSTFIIRNMDELLPNRRAVKHNVEDVVNLNLTLDSAKHLREKFKDKEIKELASKWVEAYEYLDSELKGDINTAKSVSDLVTLDNKIRNLLDD